MILLSNFLTSSFYRALNFFPFLEISVNHKSFFSKSTTLLNYQIKLGVKSVLVVVILIVINFLIYIIVIQNIFNLSYLHSVIYMDIP